MLRDRKEIKDFTSSSPIGRAFIIAVNFGTGVAVLGLAGRYLNRKYDHDFDYMLAGVCLGLAWGFYETFKLAYQVLIKNENHNENQDEKKQRSN